MGRPETLLDGLDEPTRERLREAVISEARGRYVEIYRTFGLADRGIEADSFYRWARKVRRARAKELAEDRTQSSPPPSGSSSGLAMSTVLRVLENVNARMDAGDTKSLPHLAATAKACIDVIRLDFERESEKRAGEKHEAWKETVSKALRTAVEGKTEGGETLTREAVYDMIDSIMRGG